MTQPVPQRLLLVCSPADVAPPWQLSTLRDHLRLEGHEVVVTGDVDADGSGWAGVDVIHAFGWIAGMAVAARGASIPWVLTPPWSGSGSDAANVARSADLVLCASSEDADAANRLGVSRQRCLVMPIGVDVDVFTRLGPSANRTTTHRVMARALGPGDGVLDVVAALPAIPGAELVILVDGAKRGDLSRYHRSLQDAAQDAGVRARVALVPARDPMERSWLLRSADVVVSMSGEAGDHALVAEAMACGKAVVVTPTGSQRDLVVNDVTGLHVPAGHVRALALSLRTLLRDTFMLEGMGLAGADRVLSRSAWPRVAHELGAAYARVASRSAVVGDDEVDLDEDTVQVIGPDAFDRGSTG